MPEDQRTSSAGYLNLLARGGLELEGRLPWSSNRTFLVTCTRDGRSVQAVYKPGAGERPLWDFPGGLYRREAAAYELAEALGWPIVPETVIRDDAPLGAGSLQRFVEADFSEHYFSLMEEDAYRDKLRVIATFDLVANNADRKSGHCLLGTDGRIWAIDNGLCFHPQPKLRTVMWEFGGEPIPDSLIGDLSQLAARDLAWSSNGLGGLLAGDELEALALRARAIVAHPVFPDPRPDRRPYPWPLV